MGYDASTHLASTEGVVRLPLASRLRGTYLIGKNGTGKTTLLAHMIAQDILDDRGVCVLDPHGNLIDDVLAQVPGERCDDVILLDLRASETPFGLNLFQCTDPSDPIIAAETTGQVVQVFKKIWGDLSWGPLLEDLLANIAHTMIENAGYTMAEVPQLLTDDAFRRELVGNVQNSVVRDFWAYEYDPMTDREQRENRRSTLNKVRDFLRNPLVRNIVGQSETTVDFDEVIGENKILLIKLDSRLEQATSLIGSMLVQQLLNSALGRKERDNRHPFMLYADEYHRFSTPAFATLIEEARKYGIATTIAHQRRSQLTPGEQRAAPLSSVNLIVFAVTGEDAKELAGEFDASPIPGEKVLKMVTEPVYDEWIEVVWDPPSAKERLAGAQERLKQVQLELDVMVWRRHGTRYEWFDKATDEELSQLFLPETHWFSVPQREGFTPPKILARRPEDKARLPEHHNNSFGPGYYEWLLWHIGPEWPSTLRNHLINQRGRREAVAKKYLQELDPIERRFRSAHQRFWAYPRHRSIASHMRITDFVTIPCPQGVAWYRKTVKKLRDEEQALQREIDQLLTCRQRIPRRRYLYEQPIRDITNSATTRSGQAEVQRYRWEDGPARTYADMHGEIANELVSLPDFHAKARLATAEGITEHRIMSLRWLAGESACAPLPAGRPRPLVELEIRQRGETEVFADEPPRKRQRRRAFH